MSMLLVASLRKFGGLMKDAAIYSYQPRKGMGVGKGTEKFFERHNVTLVDLPLNNDFPDYPLANKIYASSHAEKNLNSEILVFLDSDIFFLREPLEFLIPRDYDAVLRPVDSKNVGAENEEDPNWEYWRKLYDITGVKDYSYVNTCIDRKRVLSYWNGGHMVVKREKEVFQHWGENFNKVMKEGLMPRDGLFFVEQSVFAATVSALDCRVKRFSSMYNYPVHLHARIPDPEQRADSISQVVSAHYHKIFRDGFARDILGPMTEPDDPKSRWLLKELIEFGLIGKGEIPMNRSGLWGLIDNIARVFKPARVE